MKWRLFVLALIAGGLVGCGSSGGSSTTTPGEAPKTTETTPPKTDPIPEPAKPKLADLPADLRHEGFEWYGLGNDKPIKMVLNQAGTKLSGEQSYELEKVENGSATFKQTWTGGLPMDGDVRIKLDAKGIYGLEAQGKTLDPPQMELPAKITIGESWKSGGKIEVPNGSVENTVRKIVGYKTITIGKKSVQTLLVTSTSQLKMTGAAQTMETKEYYQKGVGAVKLEVKVTGGDQPPRTFSLEAQL